jgi:predicted nucleic acid-binding protein
VPLYVDSSAFVKLLVDEPESEALEAYMRGSDLLTSVLTLIEVHRSVRRSDSQRDISVGDVFDGVQIRALDDEVVDQASALQPLALRTLDAIHLATALDLRSELDAFITYDVRLAEAARTQRLPVVSPA